MPTEEREICGPVWAPDYCSTVNSPITQLSLRNVFDPPFSQTTVRFVKYGS